MKVNPPTLYLASASPRRREILAQLGIAFHVLEHAVDESPLAGEPPRSYVRRLAGNKAKSGLAALPAGQNIAVLAADTAVVHGTGILGKPADRQEAVEMLRLLSSATHQVHTAVAVASARGTAVRVSTTEVEFRELTLAEIHAYWDTGEPRDKAGAYAIQGLGALFVKKISGSYSGVVGLPVFETFQLLETFGLTAEEVLRGEGP